ncbi:MAG: ATP-binding protein [Filomicrobium sp.]
MFKRLSTQIYLTVLITLMLVVFIAGGIWRISGGEREFRQAVFVAGELLANGLPPATAPTSEQRDAAVDLARRLRLDLALYSATGDRIASYGRRVPSPFRDWRDRERRDGRPLRGRHGGFIRGPGGPAWSVPLPDGRFIVARAPDRRPVPRPIRFVVILAAVALLVGLCAWPVARGLTRRLERLQEGVERLGGGDLSARVAVQGRDEVAKLAGSFNTSAERIEQLVNANKLLLANASHELRTPLARIRMGLELFESDPSQKRRDDLEKDISELDDMIGEILLLSRLDQIDQMHERSETDLLALAAEEASRYPNLDVSGQPVIINGDAKLLRRLVRNLLENAMKHGAAPISISVAPDQKGERPGAVLVVSDAGPGISADLAEQVFEPFHRGPSRGRASGSGLGLALVRSIAERHGGSARFEAGNDGRLNRVVVKLATDR